MTLSERSSHTWHLAKCADVESATACGSGLQAGLNGYVCTNRLADSTT